MTVTRASLKALLNKYNLYPRKGLGQNFLADVHHLEQIIQAAELTSADTVLEIGPGPGTLTQYLAEQSGRVIAVELDSQMVTLLRTEYIDFENLTVVEADILKTKITDLLPDDVDTFKVVANLPYYITSAVIRHLLESQSQPTRLVVMVQKEVAQRMVAQAGNMSVLAVSVQFYGQPEIVHHVPAGAFHPPPKVDSAVVRIDTYPAPPIPVDNISHFFRIVKAGFGKKRKQLKNSLKAGLPYSSDDIVSALNQAEIDPTRRAETLTLTEWGRLAEAFKSLA